MFVLVNVISYPAVNSHLTCKEYVDNNITWGVDNSSLLRLDSNENLDIPNQRSYNFKFSIYKSSNNNKYCYQQSTFG